MPETLASLLWNWTGFWAFCKVHDSSEDEKGKSGYARACKGFSSKDYICLGRSCDLHFLCN